VFGHLGDEPSGVATLDEFNWSGGLRPVDNHDESDFHNRYSFDSQEIQRIAGYDVGVPLKGRQ
jgi:hypothetical protein